jgi:ElaB/YqjD/DUF883 family membrane-anchored ribosome-binding protein
VIRIHLARPVAIILPTMAVLFGLAACASTSEQAASVRRVDDLLSSIERVQVDVAVAKDKAHGALHALTQLVAPGFTGDAAKSYAGLRADIEESEKQTQALHRSLTPMSDAAESVFQRWTADLESFGNTRMRQRSQTRLDETRARYQGLLTSTQSALLSFDAFNADLRDQALFLGSDLNAAAIASILPDLRTLHEQAKELDARADACAAAARTYVESAALHGQIETATTSEAQPTSDTDKPKTQFAKRRSSTLKPHALPQHPADETGTPDDATQPAQTPAPESTPPSNEKPSSPSGSGSGHP